MRHTILLHYRYVLLGSILILTFSIIHMLSAKHPRVGEYAPKFVTSDSKGLLFSLEEELSHKKRVILVFYPKDASSYCTQQVCTIRDTFTSISPDITIVGISSGSQESHEKFTQAHSLPFRLLMDLDNKIRKLYGGYTWFGIEARLTVVIERSGIIAAQYSSLFDLDGHQKIINQWKS